MARKLLLPAITAVMCVISFPVLTLASDNPMADFYGGLAKIIERNMNEPGACVNEAKHYINDNSKALRIIAEKGNTMAQSNRRKHENMSAADLENAMKEAEKAMADPRVMESMNRYMSAMNAFMDAMGEFGSRHSEEAEQIMTMINAYFPQGEMQ